MKKIFTTIMSTGLLLTALSASSAVQHYNQIANMPAPKMAYSTAVQANGFIFLSGQIGIHPDTQKLVQSSYADEVKQTLENVKTIVEGLGGNLKDVAKLTIYVTDMSNYTVTNQLVGEYFRAPYPAREIIGITSLAANANIEITATMVVPNQTKSVQQK